jgi:hypothetical protein
MNSPLTIHYRGLSRSRQLEDLIVERVERLLRQCTLPLHLDVLVEASPSASKGGKPSGEARARVEASLGTDRVLRAEARSPQAGLDLPLLVCVRRAFDKAEDQLPPDDSPLFNPERGDATKGSSSSHHLLTPNPGKT